MNRQLKKICPTWLTTPRRRLFQTLCFILFIMLFFYCSRSCRFDFNNENGHLGNIELFLTLDPLVGISAAVASRTLVWSLSAAAAVLFTCIFFPRWFCSYACPMGTLIDLFDWSVGSRIKRFRIKRRGWWVNLRFYLLTAILIAAMCGVLLSGFVAAIPVLTRGLLYIITPLQYGILKNWHSLPPFNTAQYFSIILFILIFLLGLLRPRFWCAYICPSGALLSLAGIFRMVERRVDNTCTGCSRCLKACPFDVISTDFSARFIACTSCFTCKNICGQNSIKFVFRWNRQKNESHSNIPVSSSVTRRGFIIGSFASLGVSTAAAMGITLEQDQYNQSYVVRPPGSVPEKLFLSQCIRCGLCIKVCPENSLQPIGLECGINGIWTPAVKADIAGCKPFCSNCGQACPTGAIRELIPEEKKAARIGFAVVDKDRCLPYSQKEPCGLCLEACSSAGYNAIEYIRIGPESQGISSAGSGFLAPFVSPQKCIGCGLCQARCYSVMVNDKKILDRSAIQIQAGPGKEDRLTAGSYLAVQAERKKTADQNQIKAPQIDYLPDFLK